MERKNLAARAGHWSATHRKTVIWGWLGFVVLAVMVGNVVGSNTIHGADQFSGESGKAEHALYSSGLRPNDEHVLIQNQDLTVKDPRFQATIKDVAGRLEQTDHVVKVESPLHGKGSVSPDAHSALVDFRITGDDLEGRDRVEPSQDAVDAVAAEHPDFNIDQFGSVSTQKELQNIFTSDLLKAETLSLPLTLLILIFAFGSIVAALVPLFIGITAVAAAEALVALPSHISPIDSNLSSVILLIGLAVGVDYSLFYLRREREERAAGRDPATALDVAAATSGRAVLISGLTVMAAMAGLFLSGDKTFLSFGIGTMLVVGIAMLGSVTVLPGVLAWLGDRVEKGRLPLIGRRNTAGKSRFWSALVDRVMRRPWLSIVLATGALLALAIPALSMKIVVTGPDDLPQNLELIKTYNRLRDAFPKEGVTVDVAVQAPNVKAIPVAGGIRQLDQQARQAPLVLRGSDITISKDHKVALVSIPTKGNGNDAESTAALNDIRNRIIPATIGAVPGTTVDVTGNAAQSADFRNLLNARLPLIIAFVFSLAFLLLLTTFRSIVIPIKAILLNLLSLGAAYGVLVLVFQDGNLEGLLDFHSNGGVTSWLPLFLFVILFGLSMDYHVFILSRVREAYLGGMSTREAVRNGIATTAGTVTSAAVVMVVVFSVFATLSFLDFKEMGVGLATAVLIDATIIRGVLLPATMSVLGDWNWYLPRWLEWIPQPGVSEPGAAMSAPAGPQAVARRPIR